MRRLEMGYLKQAGAVWMATLLAYWLVGWIETRRDRRHRHHAASAALAGTLGVYLVLLVIPSTLYLIGLVGLSALLAPTPLYVPLLVLLGLIGVWGLKAALTGMPAKGDQGLSRHFVLFFAIMTLCGSVLSIPPLLRAYHA